jgi:CTP:phosphocholine cytidylyltransferase-like protein
MENAIIMASGLGTRMRPLTETKPKPLIEVCGKPMIETVIDALKIRGVKNIVIVVGYLKEQFNYLLQKYTNITIVENSDYMTVNNISSVFYAKDVLYNGPCFICEADLYIVNHEIFGRSIIKSCYFGKYIDGYSADWVFDVGADGFITRVCKGGMDRYNMVGLSYFNKSDAKILADKITQTYGKAGYENLFWDDVVNANIKELKLVVNRVEPDDIYEIDTVDELIEINNKKRNN